MLPFVSIMAANIFYYVSALLKTLESFQDSPELMSKTIDVGASFVLNLKIREQRGNSVVTANEIMKATGVSYAMFTRLKQLGVVPRPQVRGLGRNKGILYSYPDEVKGIVIWVLMEHRRGNTLVEIADRWRRGEVVEEELATVKANPDELHWATDLYAEALGRYPGDYDIWGNIESTEEQEDGSLVVRVKLRKIPRK